VKSQSNGNREIITVTDVVPGAANAPAAGGLQLENLFSDKFDIADADGLTAKWQDSVSSPSSGSNLSDINTTQANALYQKVTVAGNVPIAARALPQKLTGDFSVQVMLDLITNNLDGNYFQFYLVQDANNQMMIERYYYAGIQKILFWRNIGGVATSDGFVTSDVSVSLRLRRVGSTIYGAYDVNQGETWTEWTKTGAFSGDVEVILRTAGAAAAGVRDGYWRNFKINSGTIATGGYRTSGNFVSRVVDCGAAGQKITRVVLGVNCPSAATTLKNGASNALELYENDVNNFATALKLDGWTNAELLTAGMTENGVNSTILLTGLTLGRRRYKWYKLFGIGSGTATFKVFDVTTTYSSGVSYLKVDGEVFS